MPRRGIKTAKRKNAESSRIKTAEKIAEKKSVFLCRRGRTIEKVKSEGGTFMKCLYCDCTESKVIDSRSADDDRTIRRRRECVGCGRRFTTYETIEVTPVLVVKNNGTRQSFNAEKIRNGIIKSCEKRPVPMAVIDGMVTDISKQVYNSMESEVTSKQIGEMVMERLKKVDEVAYVRYASVYRSFKDISSFLSELKEMMKEGNRERSKIEKAGREIKELGGGKTENE